MNDPVFARKYTLGPYDLWMNIRQPPTTVVVRVWSSSTQTANVNDSRCLNPKTEWKRKRPMDMAATTPTYSFNTPTATTDCCPWSGPVQHKWSKLARPRCSSKQVSQCPIATAQNGMKTLYTLYISTTLLLYIHILLPYILYVFFIFYYF